MATRARSATSPMVNRGSDTLPLDLKPGSTVKVEVWSEQHAPPNHHADYPGFRGVAGLVAGSAWPSDAGAMRSLPCDSVHMGSGDRVLDVGCGPGVAARYAARLGATVTGVDPAPVMLRVARLLTPSSAKVRYANGAAEDNPTSRGICFGGCGRSRTVHHWSAIDAGLREVRRVLLPGGRLVAMERRAKPGVRGHGSHGWTDEQASAFVDPCRKKAVSPTCVWNGQQSGADQRSVW